MEKVLGKKGRMILGFLLASFIFGCGMVTGQYVEKEENTAVTKSTQEKINLNTADYYTLISLEGIGDTTARGILDYRRECGGFNELADLVALDLISQSTADAIADQVVVEFP